MPRPEYGHGYAPVHSHEGSGGNDAMDAHMRQPTYKIYCKDNDRINLAIRNGVVLLTIFNERSLSGLEIPLFISFLFVDLCFYIKVRANHKFREICRSITLDLVADLFLLFDF